MTDTAWMQEARRLIGTRELPGAANSPTIMGWAKRLGSRILGMVYSADSVPWCGLFVAHCVNAAGLDPAPIAIRASSWATWGADLRADRLAPGAVLVFSRSGGGHVAFYLGEDRDAYHVLGGNQSDAVNITRILKSRCVARRWPRGVPVAGAPVWMTTGGKVSTNEA